MGLFSLFLASCPLIEGRQREWNEREALASLEWNFSAAEGPPAHNPQQRIVKLPHTAPPHSINNSLFIPIIDFICFAGRFGAGPRAPITNQINSLCWIQFAFTSFNQISSTAAQVDWFVLFALFAFVGLVLACLFLCGAMAGGPAHNPPQFINNQTNQPLINSQINPNTHSSRLPCFLVD